MTASRCLTDSEKNYPQSEKELLAIYFATSKFDDFICGLPVNVQTDHKPLVASPRLQRLRLKLLFNVYYVPGKYLYLADGMSCMPLRETEKDHEILETIHSLSAHLPMSNASQDSILPSVSKMHQGGWPTASKLLQECRASYIIPHTIPRLPYIKVAADILEEAGNAYLVLIDCFSHWLDIRPLNAKSSAIVINAMQDIFNINGFPKVLIADNIPFKSYECQQYYIPTNTEAMAWLKKLWGSAKRLYAKASNTEGVDHRDLLKEYNSTPITGRQASPAQILFI
ncbi:hypothetical protein PR048_001765 [Dryococelus australis]|uniref:Reverse transcriptase RNase H-like domain-containing protein n=1 Tax=Dryococelus australis TaxID=614101 RepID=A0ABQ9IJB4_9NEOP|nr:hypothetical protein PR048_001765 [Dryococelus australis]